MHRDNRYTITPQAPIHSGFGPQTTAREGGRVSIINYSARRCHTIRGCSVSLIL